MLVRKRRSLAPITNLVLKPTRLATQSQNWCGPTAIAALTGLSYDEAALAIRAINNKTMVAGTTYTEVLRVLDRVGYRWETRSMPGPVKEHPTVAAWLRQRSYDERNLPVLVDAGNHWMVVLRNKMMCSLTGSVPVNLSDYPRRRKRVKYVFLLKPPRTSKQLDELRQKLDAKVSAKPRRTMDMALLRLRKLAKQHGFTSTLVDARLIKITPFGKFPKGIEFPHDSWSNTLQHVQSCLKDPTMVNEDGWFGYY